MAHVSVLELGAQSARGVALTSSTTDFLQQCHTHESSQYRSAYRRQYAERVDEAMLTPGSRTIASLWKKGSYGGETRLSPCVMFEESGNELSWRLLEQSLLLLCAAPECWCCTKVILSLKLCTIVYCHHHKFDR